MPMLADSHIHIFENGYKGSGLGEISLYEDLIERHKIESALVVGFEGESWAKGNNAYIATLAQTRPWIHPLAFLEIQDLQVSRLEELHASGFDGIALYIFSEAEVANLIALDETVWGWLLDHKWMISVNSKGILWNVWLDVIRKWPQLVLLISHLGLPKVDLDHLALEDISSELSTIGKLHRAENVYLKLSGFYALEQRQPIYPYPSLRNYLLYIVNSFDLNRLIWGSDFSPALGSVSFTQTFEFLSDLDFIQQTDREKILHGNLLRLLEQPR